MKSPTVQFLWSIMFFSLHIYLVKQNLALEDNRILIRYLVHINVSDVYKESFWMFKGYIYEILEQNIHFLKLEKEFSKK
jgi:hypothetical protein